MQRSASAKAGVGARRHSYLLWGGLLTIYLVWGSTYLAIRIMVETIPPLLGAGARFLGAGLVVIGLLALRGGAARIRVTRREIVSLAVVGALLLAGGNGLVTLAEKEAPSGLAALIIASIPLFVVLLRLLVREPVPRATLAGVAIGLVGVAALVVPSDRPEGAALWSVLVLVVAAASWALGSFISPRVSLPQDVFVSTGWEMVLGGLLIAIIGVLAGEVGEADPGAFSARSLAALVYLLVAGSLLAFTAYVWLLQNAPISTVATYAFVNPVVAVVLGWAILSEEVTASVIVGAAAIVLSVAFVVLKEGGAEPAADKAPAEASGPGGPALERPEGAVPSRR